MTNWEKYFGSPERAAASLKDMETGMADAHKQFDEMILAKEVDDPMEWILEQSGFGFPKNNTTHGLIEWLQDEAD